MRRSSALARSLPIAGYRNIQAAGALSASRMVRDARGTSAFTKTAHLVPDGPACRVYGAMLVKRVTGNLHIVRWLPASQPSSIDRVHRRLWAMAT